MTRWSRGAFVDMESQRRRVLVEVARHLHRIGSANDAEDHHYEDEAERMRDEACAALRSLLEEHPFLSDLLPKLRWELDTRHILGFGWSQLLDALEMHLSDVDEQEHR